jgi:hypothetical protein
MGSSGGGKVDLYRRLAMDSIYPPAWQETGLCALARGSGVLDRRRERRNDAEWLLNKQAGREEAKSGRGQRADKYLECLCPVREGVSHN